VRTVAHRQIAGKSELHQIELIFKLLGSPNVRLTVIFDASAQSLAARCAAPDRLGSRPFLAQHDLCPAGDRRTVKHARGCESCSARVSTRSVHARTRVDQSRANAASNRKRSAKAIERPSRVCGGAHGCASFVAEERRGNEGQGKAGQAVYVWTDRRRSGRPTRRYLAPRTCAFRSSRTTT
jgi:hypothetical protein